MTSARSGSTLAAVTGDLARNPVLSLSLSLSLPATAGVGTAVMLGPAFQIGLLLFFGLMGFAVLIVTSAAGARDYRGPRQWQQMTGRDLDQHHSPDA